MKKLGGVILFVFVALPVGADGCDPAIFSDLVDQGRAVRGSLEEERTDPVLAQLGDAYTAGLDAVDTMLGGAELLRKGSIDPARSPVGVFDDEIERLLSVVESGLHGWSYWRRLMDGGYAERLAALEVFKQEAKGCRDSGRVAYRWWNNFGYRASLLATPNDKRSRYGFSQHLYKTQGWLSDEQLEMAYKMSYEGKVGETLGNLLDLFPAVVVWPTLDRLGVVGFNRLFMTGVHPFGVVGEAVHADGRKMYPDEYSEHDFGHTREIIPWEAELGTSPYGRWGGDRVGLLRFHRAFLRRVGDLSVREHRMAELMYFFASHEAPHHIGEVAAGRAHLLEDWFSQEYVMDVYAQAFQKPGAAALLPDDVDGRSRASIGVFLRESASVFRKLAEEIVDEMNDGR